MDLREQGGGLWHWLFSRLLSRLRVKLQCRQDKKEAYVPCDRGGTYPMTPTLSDLALEPGLQMHVILIHGRFDVAPFSENPTSVYILMDIFWGVFFL